MTNEQTALVIRMIQDRLNEHIDDIDSFLGPSVGREKHVLPIKENAFVNTGTFSILTDDQKMESGNYKKVEGNALCLYAIRKFVKDLDLNFREED